MSEEILLSQIIEDPAIQPRSKINTSVVNDYAQAMRLGEHFPAIDVFRIDGAVYVTDGFHRFHAARMIGRESILAEVHSGSLRDAIIFAALSNARHGLPRTRADKRCAVQRLLDDPEWSQKSNVAIADACLVSEHLVRSIRNSSSPGSKIPKERQVQRKTIIYTVRTENIGKGRKSSQQSGGEPVQHQDDIPGSVALATPDPASIPEKEAEPLPQTKPDVPGTVATNPAIVMKESTVDQGVKIDKPASNTPDVIAIAGGKLVPTSAHKDMCVVGRTRLPDKREKWFIDLVNCTFPDEDQKIIQKLIQAGKFKEEMKLVFQVVQSVNAQVFSDGL
jgi:hypothetical protein